MLPLEGRGGTICIWFITVFFFLSIIGGGSLLVLYITLPESNSTFAIVGMILIGIPWTFWIFTCVYRSVVEKNICPPPPIRAAAVAPDGGPSPSNGAVLESPVDSPGGARRVRFGNATVLGPHEGAGTGEGNMEDRGSPQACTSMSEGSSTASRESERPLTLSMS